MAYLKHARGFRELVLYQKAREASRELFGVSKLFPKEEMYSLTDQLRRASRSIGAQISEAWAKRRYPKHFVSKLTDADAEQNETQHWIDTAMDCGYLTEGDASRLNSKLTEIGKMLNSMVNKADLFCGSPPTTVQESATEYFTLGD